VIIGGALVVLGVTGAIIFDVSKQNALDNGRKVASDIQKNGGGPTTCSQSGVASTKFGPLCVALQDNVNTANTDNTLANVGVGVAIGGAVLAVGWYLLAPKREQSGTTAASATFVPVFGGPREGNGLAFVKRF
jgi:hypothetical protein